VLYVDGIQAASQGGFGALLYAPVPVGIGATWQNNIPTFLFTNFIDEVSLYDRALTAAEISAIVTAGAAGKSAAGPYITTGLLLPAATVGQPHTQAFTSVLGTPPVSYTLSAASAAPPGVTLTSAGVLSGTPTASGVFGFRVVATDAAALSDEQPFTLQANG
jgi:Putative Ig domain/Concanavalin A-like lectin/glucanases superfamily